MADPIPADHATTDHVTAAPPSQTSQTSQPLSPCFGCGTILLRGVIFRRLATDNGDVNHDDDHDHDGDDNLIAICFRCLHDHDVVAPSDRSSWKASEAPYMRLRLVRPGQAPAKMIEVTALSSLVVGRKQKKFDGLHPQLQRNQSNVHFFFEVVDDRKVGGVHLMFSYSRRSQTFRVMSYAKDKRRTFCDRPITAKPELMTNVESIRGFQVLAEMEYYHVMFPGTRVLLVNPDETASGPRIIVDDIRGCLGLEGFRQAVGTPPDTEPDPKTDEERLSNDRVWNYGSTQTASNRYSFDLAVAVTAGSEAVVSQALLTPERVVIFSGTARGCAEPALLVRGDADPAGLVDDHGAQFASALPGELTDRLNGHLKDKHKKAWTHVHRVPMDDPAFHGPLFLVRYLAGKTMYVMVPIHDQLRKSRRGDPNLTHVISTKTHEFFASLVVEAGMARFSVVAHKRLPLRVFPLRAALRTDTSVTLEWTAAESLAPVVRYEICERLAGGAVVAADDEGPSTSGLPPSPSPSPSPPPATTVMAGGKQKRQVPEPAGGSVLANARVVAACEGLVKSLRVTGLQPDTCYELFVHALTEEGGVKSDVVRVATSRLPSAPRNGLRLTGGVLDSTEAATTYEATYGGERVAVTEYAPVDGRSHQARLLRERISVVQGLTHCDHVAQFMGGTEFAPAGSDDVVFQIRSEVPMPSLESVWREADGSPALVSLVCRHVATALGFLHRARVVHRNVNPATVVVRRETETCPLANATYVLAGFDLAVMESSLRRELRASMAGALMGGGGGGGEGGVAHAPAEYSTRAEDDEMALLITAPGPMAGPSSSVATAAAAAHPSSTSFESDHDDETFMPDLGETGGRGAPTATGKGALTGAYAASAVVEGPLPVPVACSQYGRDGFCQPAGNHGDNDDDNDNGDDLEPSPSVDLFSLGCLALCLASPRSRESVEGDWAGQMMDIVDAGAEVC